MGVFSKSQGPANDVKRNSYDGSFDNHCTLNFGELVPVLCKEAIPGDTFEIDSAVGINAMPTFFPIQSKINASVHYFYVRGKNLWKDYYDWYFGTKEGLTPPYIAPSQFEGKPLTGTIFDYMGLPTTLIGSKGGSLALSDYGGYYPKVSTYKQKTPGFVSSFDFPDLPNSSIAFFRNSDSSTQPLLNDVIFRTLPGTYYKDAAGASDPAACRAVNTMPVQASFPSDTPVSPAWNAECIPSSCSFLMHFPFSTDFSFANYTI